MSGTGNATLTITVDSSKLGGPGPTYGIITVTDPAALNSPQVIEVWGTIYPSGGSGVPFGDFATPLDNTTGVTGAIPVTGWVLDDIETTSVQICRDPVLGTNALGDILVAISRQSLDVHLKKAVIDPLGMTDTSYKVPRAKSARVATVHRRVGPSTHEDPNPYPLPGYVSADGDLFSTANDYGRLVRMLLNDGSIDGRRVLSEDAVRAMRAAQMGDLRVRTQPSANPGMSRPFPLGAVTDTWGLGFQLAGPGGGPTAAAKEVCPGADFTIPSSGRIRCGAWALS